MLSNEIHNYDVNFGIKFLYFGPIIDLEQLTYVVINWVSDLIVSHLQLLSILNNMLLMGFGVEWWLFYQLCGFVLDGF